MTVSELIKTLQDFESQGFGDREVHVMQYAGGTDEPCNVVPVVPVGDWEPIMLQTTYVR